MRLFLALLACGLVAGCGGGEDRRPLGRSADCTRWAAPGGDDGAPGTKAQPLRTAQRLADSVRAGETGCLRDGEYVGAADEPYVLSFGRGGRRGAPLTLRSAPGERAVLRGIVYVPQGSDHVTLADLEIDGRHPAAPEPDPVSVQVMAADTLLEGNRIGNGHTKSCLILGSNGEWGPARRTVIRDNVFAGCGDPDHGMLDHAVYLEASTRAVITGNRFLRTAGWAIHLYPNAQATRVEGNVLDDNGGGVIFAGQEDYASSDNVVRGNVISRSRRGPHLESSFGGPVGEGNVAERNCLVEDSVVVGAQIGFSARDNVLVKDAGYAGDHRLERDSPCRAVLRDPRR